MKKFVGSLKLSEIYYKLLYLRNNIFETTLTDKDVVFKKPGWQHIPIFVFLGFMFASIIALTYNVKLNGIGSVIFFSVLGSIFLVICLLAELEVCKAKVIINKERMIYQGVFRKIVVARGEIEEILPAGLMLIIKCYGGKKFRFHYNFQNYKILMQFLYMFTCIDNKGEQEPV